MQQVGIQHGVISNYHNGGFQNVGGGGYGCPGPTPGLDLRVDVLTWDKRGELRGHHQRKTDHSHWRIPPSLHPVALTGLVGGPDTLPGPRYHS